jgi:Ni,Fe-hydrogenase I large subunit
MQALAGRSVDGAELRFAARLLELAQLLDDCAPPAVGVLARPDGHGTAWVQNARGLLIHDVQVEPRGDARPGATRVLGYRIVAPTEWNFHGRGALAAELLGRPFADAAAARAAATRLVHSLDPCVACRVEIDDA